MAFMDEFQHLKIQLVEIKLATNNFGDSNLIGTGGFGKVYKGEISHSKGRSMGAIKRLDSRHGQGNSEFWREIMMLSRYTHENLVSLLGFCDEDGEKILVYEHASRGSLDRHLSATTLTWMQRLRICVAAARGLSYLHDPNETQQRVLHRDIKSSNILLDENWNAKVSDMGLSKIGPANQQHTALVSNVVGTMGYVDPLYMEMGLLTKESDVYSFGVLLFEVLCGRLCFEYSNGCCQILVRMWKISWKQKKLDEIVFQDLKQQMDSTSLGKISDIAYQCLKRSREKRPPMALVVEELEIALELQEIYEAAVTIVVPPLISRSKEELNMLPSKGILVKGTKTVEHEATENIETEDMLPISDSNKDWEQKLPNDHEEIINWSKCCLKWTKKKQLYSLFCKGFLLSNSEEWFFITKDGKKCYMLSARAALQNEWWGWRSLPSSRFEEVACNPFRKFNILSKIKPQLLSPQTTYASYLIYKFLEDHSIFEAPGKVMNKDFPSRFWYIYLLGPQNPEVDQINQSPFDRLKMKSLPQLRNDGWMEVQVWEFQTYTTMEMFPKHVDLIISFSNPLFGLVVQGIEFRPSSF